MQPPTDTAGWDDAAIRAVLRGYIVEHRPHGLDQAGGRFMRSDFSWTQSARHYVELYQKLVGVGASAAV